MKMHPAAYRLKGLIRTELPGRCKKLSIGDQCECGLCDVERMQETLDHCLEIINECILNGMPVTEQVAKVSNQIRGVAFLRELPCSYCNRPEFKGWQNGKCPYCGKTNPDQ